MLQIISIVGYLTIGVLVVDQLAHGVPSNSWRLPDKIFGVVIWPIYILVLVPAFIWLFAIMRCRSAWAQELVLFGGPLVMQVLIYFVMIAGGVQP